MSSSNHLQPDPNECYTAQCIPNMRGDGAVCHSYCYSTSIDQAACTSTGKSTEEKRESIFFFHESLRAEPALFFSGVNGVSDHSLNLPDQTRKWYEWKDVMTNTIQMQTCVLQLPGGGIMPLEECLKIGGKWSVGLEWMDETLNTKER